MRTILLSLFIFSALVQAETLCQKKLSSLVMAYQQALEQSIPQGEFKLAKEYFYNRRRLINSNITYQIPEYRGWLGFMDYVYDKEARLLHISNIKVVAKVAGHEVPYPGITLRRKNISKILLGKVLERYNGEVDRITSSIIQTNMKVFKDNEHLGRINALKMTPAYKIRDSFGFTEVVEVVERYSRKFGGRYIEFVVERP